VDEHKGGKIKKGVKAVTLKKRGCKSPAKVKAEGKGNFLIKH